MADQDGETAEAQAEAEAIVEAMGLGAVEAEEETEPAEAEPADAEEAEGEEKPEEPAAELPDEDWVKTPEGVAAKAEEAKRQLELAAKERTEFQKRYNVLERREKKLKASVERFKRTKGESETMVRWLSTNLEAVRTGDAQTVLNALGALTGQSGHEFYENLSLRLASDGQMGGDKTTRELQELRSQLAQVTQALHGRQQQEQVSGQQRELAEFRAQALELGKTGGNAVCARIAEADPDLFQDEAQRIALTFRQQNGRPIDRASLLGRLESRFAKLGSLAPSGGASSQDGGTDLETVAEAQPEKARRSPRAQSIPRTVAAGATKRPLSDDERRRQAIDLIPDDWIRQHA